MSYPFRRQASAARPPFYALSLTIAAALNVSVVMAAEQIMAFEIPPQALGGALNAYADAAGVQLSYPAELTSGLKSPGVSGQYTARQALQRLLTGTGVVARTTQNGTVTLEKTATTEPRSSATMPAVKVVGQAVYDSTDPYNPDYSLPNASTATKTDTPIMETPYSIQVVPKQVIDDIQGIRPNDALDYVSGVYRSSGSGDFFESSTRRGFNSLSGDYRDGAPFPVADYIIGGRDLASTERVEVLKGPASLLYGMTNPGGVVNYITKKPLATPYYSLQQQFGSYDLYRTTVDATGPITDDKSLLYRFNLAYKSADSFRDFVNSERTFIAPMVTWNISPRTQINFELEYDTGHVVFDRGIPAIGNRPANLPQNRFLGEPVNYEYERIMVGMNWSHAFNENWTLSHRFNMQFLGQNGSSTSGTGMVDATTLRRFGLYQSQSPEDQPVYYNSVNLMGHFDTYGLKHTLLLGGDHYHSSVDTTQRFISSTININDPVYLGLPAALGNPATNNQLSVSSDWFGLYLQDQIKLPYHLSMLAGFRYDSAESSTVFNGRLSEVPRQDNLSPRGGVIWQPLPELSVYGSYSENFTSVSSPGIGGNLLQPETAQQWEFGLKTELFDKRFMGTLAWFDLTKQNVRIPDPNLPGNSLSIGEANSAGLELDIKGEVLPGWNIIGSYAYTPDATVTVGRESEVGRRFRGVPRHGGSLFSTYELQSGLFQGLKFGGGVITRSSQKTDIDATTAVLPGYTTVNLLSSYSWKMGGSTLTTQFNINNLLDKEYFPSSFNRNGIEVGAPRTFMGSVRIEY
ncbi:TonB-dependent siderophore receptor [Methylomonas methanica MC09]|uniref:TonB-dependent siderophore receptor n=2 Tax=Methylomonas methanica TaxID=421 RepID=G0A129_METMM|nr:TonB-dependent siderophore receptor [Methylomonas methanica MC09]